MSAITLNNIMLIVNDIIVKRSDIANQYKTIDSIRAFDLYEFFLKNSEFKYMTLDKTILRSYFGSDVDVDLIIMNKDALSVNEKYDLYNLHKTKYFTNYVELNNYYRSLYGLPNLDDTLKIYVTCIGVRSDVPIHELSDDEIGILDMSGILEELYTKYPKRTYLKFLGGAKIHFYEARSIRNFELLRLSTTEYVDIENIFREEYHFSRDYIVSQYYNTDLFSDDNVFAGYIGMLILLHAIRNTLSTDITASVDSIFLDNILKSYGLYDDFKDMAYVYKKQFIYNIDQLISKRHTDGVLVDISKLFNFSNVSAKRYYILKTHVLDVSGNPIFPKLPDGSIDYDSQYQLSFIKSDISESNINLETADRVSFDEITSSDPTWVFEDLTELKKSEMNLIMSKYISIEAAYNTTQLNYELSYFMNMLLDSRDSLKALYVNKYTSKENSNLFTYIIFLMATSAKIAGYDGNVLIEPYYIGELYKFNMEDITASLNDIIEEYNLNITAEQLLLSKPGNSASSSDMITVYVKNTDIYDKIATMMSETYDYKTYIGYSQLQKILFVSSNTTNVYRKTDGTIAETFLELLEDIDISLYNTVMSVEGEELTSMYMYILNRLQDIFNTDVLKFLFINTPDMNDEVLNVYYRKMVELLKPPGVDLDRIDILYKLDSDTTAIRFFEELPAHTDRTEYEPVCMDDSNIYFKKIIYITDTIESSGVFDIVY